MIFCLVFWVGICGVVVGCFCGVVWGYIDGVVIG